jgi:signal transduction histidine kinase/ActR/RegA family two-component response regulator
MPTTPPSTTAAGSSWSAWVKRLTEPRPEIEAPDERLRARALAQLTLLVGATGMMVITAQLASDPAFFPVFIGNASALLVFVVTSQLARTRRYRTAAGIAMVVTIATCANAGLLNHDDPVWWAYTLIAVLGATLLLSNRAAAVFAVLAAATVAAVLSVQGKAGQAFVGPLGWQLIIFPLVILVARGRNRLEAQRQALQSELEQGHRLELIGRMAGGIAHDFNNLLMVITTSSQLARELEGEALDEVLDDLDGARVRAAQLTTQLLAFARREALRSTDVDLAEVTGAFGSVLSAAASKRITIDVPDEVLLVQGDTSQLEQVLLNLVVNARDAIGDAGRIALRLARVASGPDGTALAGVPCALLEVADTGAGIPPELLPQIFEPFFTTKAHKGTGLGLSTVVGIVRQHGGELAVDSTLGEGTTFRAYLPLIEGTPRAPPAPRAPAGHDGRRRVLLLDDDDALRRGLARALDVEGYEVTSCATPDEALSRLEVERAVDVVISDVHMPAMTGPAFLRAARNKCPGIPAVLVTGYAFDADYRDLDDVEVLSKPLEIADLDAAIRRALQASSAQTDRRLASE